MAIYNGTGFGYGELISYTNFTVATSPAAISNLGVVFREELVTDKNKASSMIKVMDTFFVPQQEMWNQTYIVVEYPPEITLPKTITDFSYYSEEEKAMNRTQINCESMQNMDEDITCYREVRFPRIYDK